MTRYLVTGGCGFIGSHLVDALMASGNDVRVLDDLSTGRRENLPAGAALTVGSVTDADTVATAMTDVDGCFHLAAVASVARCNEEWAATHMANLTGAINVFDAARRTATSGVPVVYASSAAVYGNNRNLPLDEDEKPTPLSAYGADKLGCELHGQVAAHVHDVPTAGLRFFNVFGPRQDPRSPYSGVISIFAGRMLSDDALTVYGDGQQVRDFVYVDDVVRHLVAAMTCLHADDKNVAGHAFNVCTGVGTNLLELIDALADAAGISPDIEHGPSRLGDIRASVGRPDRARDRLKVGAETRFADGIARTVDWMRHV